MAKCRLCGNDRVLCKSHILPEFVFEPVYEEKAHKYSQISTDPAARPKRRPKGLYERLLCKGCEGLIGENEAYVRDVIYGEPGPARSVCESGIRLEGVDYRKFKLFQLGVFWRAGVSSLDEFKAVDLGPKEPELRRMVLEEEPGGVGEYPCFMFYSPKLLTELGDLLILPPDRIRIRRQIAYRCYMAGFFWVFIPSATPIDVPVEWHSISEDGVLDIMNGGRFADKLIAQLAQSFKKAGAIDRALGRRS